MASSSFVGSTALAARCWDCVAVGCYALHPVATWLACPFMVCCVLRHFWRFVFRLLTAEEDVSCYFQLTLYRNSLKIMFLVSNFDQKLLTFEKSQIRPNKAHIQQVSWSCSVLEGLMVVINAQTKVVIKGWKSSQLNQKSRSDDTKGRNRPAARWVFVCWWEQIRSFRCHLRCEAVMKGPDGRTGPLTLLSLGHRVLLSAECSHIWWKHWTLYRPLFVCNESAAL